MRKIIIYKTGERYIMDGMTFGISGGVVEKEINLDKATEEEFKKLQENPHNQNIIDTILKRG